MRKLGKYLLSIAMCFVIILPYSIYAAETDENFPDLPPSHWAYDTMMWAKAQGIIGGLPNGNAAPDRLVTQSEFTAMVNRAFVPGSDYEDEYEAINVPAGSAWDLRDYTFAVYMNWTVSQTNRGKVMTRGEVAELLTGVMGLNCSRNGSIQYLLDHNYANGKTSSTIAGYKADDTLSRAEAATFIYNLQDKGIELKPRPGQASAACTSVSKPLTDIAVGGITMDDTEAVVLDLLGEPQVKLASQYGFEWYVYNKRYEDYVQIGIDDGEVVAMLTNSANWKAPRGMGPESKYADVVKIYGDPLTYILKGNTQYMQSDNYDEVSTYLREDYYLTIYYDKHENHRISGIQLIDKDVENELEGFYGKRSEELEESFERQIFEFANVTRTLHGLEPFDWDETAAETARSHSKNMAVQAFFDHIDPKGNKPAERMEQNGIDYSMAGENIAYGQKDALEVHSGWMNSAGHRKNLLEGYERLGVGVYIKTDGTPYYTQNFYTPRTILSVLF